MGLVQLFRDVQCPDLLARHLLALALVDFRETGRHYLLHLVLSRQTARRIGTTQEVEALDEQIDRYRVQQQLPVRLTYLFSETGYARYGDGLLPLWASALLEICTLEQHWEGTLLGLPPRQPYLLPGFHSDEAAWAPAWREDFRRTWDTELRDDYPELGNWLP